MDRAWKDQKLARLLDSKKKKKQPSPSYPYKNLWLEQGDWDSFWDRSPPFS